MSLTYLRAVLCLLEQWLTEIGVLLSGNHRVQISTKSSKNQGDLCTANDNVRKEQCFFGGSVLLNSMPEARLGEFELAKNLLVSLRNYNSFGRVDISAGYPWNMDLSVDYVPPPAEWVIGDENMVCKRMQRVLSASSS